MVNKQVIFFILFAIRFCFSENENNCELDVSRYLKENFNYDVTELTEIIFINREDYEKRKKQTSLLNEEETDSLIKIRWSTKVDCFIDSVYTLDENGKFHGCVIDFWGDSLGGYTMGFYNHGKIDSVWVKKGPGKFVEYRRYSNCRPHGVWEKIRDDGSKGYFKKFHHGIVVDTAYQWWPNGNILEMEVFQNGETVYHKCFSEDGKDEIPCP